MNWLKQKAHQQQCGNKRSKFLFWHSILKPTLLILRAISLRALLLHVAEPQVTQLQVSQLQVVQIQVALLHVAEPHVALELAGSFRFQGSYTSILQRCHTFFHFDEP